MANQKKRKNVLKKLNKNKEIYLLLLPSFVLLLLFIYIPMYGVVMAFQDYNYVDGFFGSPWVGFKWFIEFFESWRFWRLLKNTVVLSLYSIALGFPIPIILALICNQMREGRFKKYFQTVMSLPHFISTVVLCGMVILFLSPSSGIISSLVGLFGGELPNLMGSATAFPTIYVVSGLWQNAGWDSILYIAALSSVDPALYEAATMDGASKFQRLLHIDIPMLVPTMSIQFILRMGTILGIGFEKVYLLQNNLNLPSSEVISTYVYQLGILGGQQSQAAAIGLFNTVVSLVFVLTVNKLSDRMTGNALM